MGSVVWYGLLPDHTPFCAYPLQEKKAHSGIHELRNGLPFLVTGLLSIIVDISISVNTGDNRSLTSHGELSVTELNSRLNLLLKPENKGR